MHWGDAPAGGDEVVVHHFVEMLFELSDSAGRVTNDHAVRRDQNVGLGGEDAVEAGFDVDDGAAEAPIASAHFREFLLEAVHLPNLTRSTYQITSESDALPGDFDHIGDGARSVAGRVDDF